MRQKTYIIKTVNTNGVALQVLTIVAFLQTTHNSHNIVLSITFGHLALWIDGINQNLCSKISVVRLNEELSAYYLIITNVVIAERPRHNVFLTGRHAVAGLPRGGRDPQSEFVGQRIGEVQACEQGIGRQ